MIEYICNSIIPKNDICKHCNHIKLHSHNDTCEEPCALNGACCTTKKQIRKDKILKINLVYERR